MTVLHKPALFFLVPVLLWFFQLSALATTATPETDDQEPLDSIIAVVNEDVILLSELDDFLRKIIMQLRARSTRLPPLEVLQRQALERMIVRRLQLQVATRTGVRVDDDTLGKAIKRIAQQNRMSIEELRSTLTRDGMDYSEFRQQIRDEITLVRLKQRQIDSKVRISDQEISDYLTQQSMSKTTNVQYNYSHILVALPEAASPGQISEKRAIAETIKTRLTAGEDFAELAVSMSNGRKALEGGAQGWSSAEQIPSLFTSTLPAMKAGETSDIIQSYSGFHIIKLNDIRGASERHTVAQTLARHILISTSELVSDQQAKSQLEKLRQRAEQGEDFAVLARKNSDDTVSAREGGNLGWVSPGTMVPLFEKKMDETAINQISAPFKTRFGWHIILVLERKTHDNTEQHLKQTARKVLRNRKIQEKTDQWLRRLRDEAYIEYRLDS
ncbi:MAG TPA: molecular chaperone SurA [Gammaproteobacteria bacterium]|nr:molecular chaperone SurA [Gammaproteobacteria bacterium]